MRPIVITIVLTVVCVLAGPAFAGGERGCCPGAALEGYDCENMCPLAQRANLCRAVGTEALVTSRVVRRDVTASIIRDLKKI